MLRLTPNPLAGELGTEALRPRQEEALNHFEYVWTQSRESMTLQSGRYEGAPPPFAIGVALEQVPPG